SRPHSTPKADGKIDPLHVNFQIIDANDQVITSAHFYASPLGGQYIWFSKSKYNNGQEARHHFPQDPAVQNIEGREKQNEKQKGQGEE
ncbi:hypothetical protein MMC22_001116, partial [Lobaria immixta]|nr:hypothetical protein [Lobaria immixta]